jgi:hypothetical protein
MMRSVLPLAVLWRSGKDRGEESPRAFAFSRLAPNDNSDQNSWNLHHDRNAVAGPPFVVAEATTYEDVDRLPRVPI